ncbi:uncharacterized protein V1518DRAFT_412841 [Limtongia smithiae]|uniref:uncharacterized protein n=1 Tax=Limtongia smithiae TaxID=1125753 RepID=UPI0034D01CC8
MDPSDWAKTQLPMLTGLDAALRCEICREFFTAPMLTECAHTFCSLCIRRSIAATPTSQSPCCPVCRTNVAEAKLRRNEALEEVALWFKRERAGMLKVAMELRGEYDEHAKSRKRRHVGEDEAVDIHSTSYDDAVVEVSRPPTPAPPSSDFIVLDREDVNDGLVPCPVCNSRMTEEQVISHLDLCLKKAEKTTTVPRSSTSSPPHQQPQQQRPGGISTYFGGSVVATAAAPAKQIARLPKLQYGIITEAKLRRTLADLGIPSQGNKQQLQRRHTEWVSIWNANADVAAVARKTKTTLLRELAEWESSLNRFEEHKPVIEGDDLKEWGKLHAGSYQDLIAQARRTVMPKQAKAESGEDTVEEGESV